LLGAKFEIVSCYENKSATVIANKLNFYALTITFPLDFPRPSPSHWRKTSGGCFIHISHHW